jgi:pimeloyl-ACP methyl ester carboxylesterase
MKPEDLMTPQRCAAGYVIILPGIEGYSWWNRGIRRGLVMAGVPFAMEIHDWTYGRPWWLWNLRDTRRHAAEAARLAAKIIDYRREHPQQPVFLVGHSAGGAMTLFTLERLPEEVRITAGILCVPAISPGYDVRPALARTDRGLWHYCSWADVFFLGLGTTLFGTCDGMHLPGAGMLGLAHAAAPPEADSAGSVPPLHQIRFEPRMLRQFNLAGHFGPVNPLFVREWIAPILLESAASPIPQTRAGGTSSEGAAARHSPRGVCQGTSPDR